MIWRSLPMVILFVVQVSACIAIGETSVRLYRALGICHPIAGNRSVCDCEGQELLCASARKAGIPVWP